MVFSSISFLFFFLPILLVVYYLFPKKYRNCILLIFSLFFYFLGEKWYVFLLLFTCLINYLCALLMNEKNSKILLVLGLIFNIGLLLYFKYTNFFISNFNNLFSMHFTFLKIILPLGISFFTFQNISYLIDVYRKDVGAQKNFWTYATYITFFPQLIAGPIVRYKDLCIELDNRKENIELFGKGVSRFTIGLAKKVLVADTIYNLYVAITNLEMSMISYWLVAVLFTLQIYFDFSGYSDMAIGLGNMFGFNLKENFNYPLIANCITDFWRRWHISLSSFFKDYVYIPLGGNKKGIKRQIINIFIVWFLTGFWHGASWNFILWGLYFFILLIIEKFILKKYLKKGIISHIYTFILIIISFVIFSISDLMSLKSFLKGMIGINIPFINKQTIFYLKESIIILIISIMGLMPIKNLFINRKGKIKILIDAGQIIFVLILLFLSVAKIISSSFNPFIYFRF